MDVILGPKASAGAPCPAASPGGPQALAVPCLRPPTVVMRSTSLFRRFHRFLTGNSRWIRERSHESYAKNYSIVFPYDEPLAGRNLRKDPLYEVRPELLGALQTLCPRSHASGKDIVASWPDIAASHRALRHSSHAQRHSCLAAQALRPLPPTGPGG